MPTSVPNYLVIDPATGRTGAVFPGGIQTNSDSPQPVSFPYPQTNSGIRWIASDGGLVAQISAYDNSNPGPRTSDTLNLQAVSPDGARTTALQLGAVNSVSPGAGSVFAFFDTFFQELIGQDGASSYPQLNGSHSPQVWNYQVAVQMAMGIITGAGAKYNGTTGWNVTRNGVGLYTISNLPTTALGWTALVTPINVGAVVECSVVNVSPNSVQYQMYNSSSGAALDWEHSFLAFGFVNTPPNI